MIEHADLYSVHNRTSGHYNNYKHLEVYSIAVSSGEESRALEAKLERRSTCQAVRYRLALVLLIISIQPAVWISIQIRTERNPLRFHRNLLTFQIHFLLMLLTLHIQKYSDCYVHVLLMGSIVRRKRYTC